MLSSLLKRFNRPAAFSTPDPNTPVCIIGDVHGCIAQLEKMLFQVPQDHRVILVGDYVDRGEHSAEVLRLVSERSDFTCLKGNHEQMLLKFLNDPTSHGPRWLRYGGLQTLSSFGVRGVRSEMNDAELQDCRDRLEDVMGQDMRRWLEQLPTSDLSGNVLVTHAGADPNVPVDQQKEETLIWGHPSFQKSDRSDGVWVVHGHTIVDAPSAKRGRIAVDTGAFATGTLSAVCLDGSEPRFVSVAH
ncbi:Serine/threonine-protein phosphatase 2 [Ruegeria sp. THAF57]|uniref:metallophosphoesterase family protein n=1 Tax=Ruegeria sp. THAF57 TaxID=2744555 RepID=UPI001769DD48|nr:metallophosphoesterase family protein [Ruegeria sp. THAF57]CAD0186673.1 Serine/threonine-protein phosphatase 2 [Ruegeria sp. THAF57]